MFPKSLAHKVSLLFTNVLSSPHGDFSLETITRELQGISSPRMPRAMGQVKDSEQDTLEMLVESLEPQQASGVVSRYEEFQDIVANVIDRGQSISSRMATLFDCLV